MIGFRKPFTKKSDPKMEKKTNKNQCQNTALNKKTMSEKAIFVQTLFCHFKIRAKIFTPQNFSLFRSTSYLDLIKIAAPI